MYFLILCHIPLKERLLLLRQIFNFIYVRRKCVKNQLSFLDYTKGPKIVSIYDTIVVQKTLGKTKLENQIEFKIDSECSEALELLKDHVR